MFDICIKTKHLRARHQRKINRKTGYKTVEPVSKYLWHYSLLLDHTPKKTMPMFVGSFQNQLAKSIFAFETHDRIESRSYKPNPESA